MKNNDTSTNRTPRLLPTSLRERVRSFITSFAFLFCLRMLYEMYLPWGRHDVGRSDVQDYMQVCLLTAFFIELYLAFEQRRSKKQQQLQLPENAITHASDTH